MDKLKFNETTHADEFNIHGNAAPEIKLMVAHILQALSGGTGFGTAVSSRTSVTEVSIDRKTDEPQKLEGTVVCKIVTGEGRLYFYLVITFYLLYY